MAWELSGQLIEACSCKSACPCALGPAEPDQGWCSGALTFAIDKGQSDGVDLSGRAVVWAIDLPKDFASGNGTVCIIIDDGADARQRRELEAIFSGKKGGPGAVLGSLLQVASDRERGDQAERGREPRNHDRQHGSCQASSHQRSGRQDHHRDERAGVWPD